MRDNCQLVFFLFPQFPPLKWAQRADSVFVTIDVPDVKDCLIAVERFGVRFRYDSGAASASAKGSVCFVEFPAARLVP